MIRQLFSRPVRHPLTKAPRRKAKTWRVSSSTRTLSIEQVESRLLLSINPSNFELSQVLSGVDIWEGVILDDQLYFSGTSDDLDVGVELWKYDPAGNEGQGRLTLVADINEGAESSYPYSLTVFAGKLYFSADDGIHGEELWEYDPAANEGNGLARMVEDLWEGDSYPSSLTIAGDKLYFTAYSVNGNDALWEFDPATHDGEGNIYPVIDLTDISESVYIEYLTSMDDQLYFALHTWDEETYSRGLWQFDPATNQGFEEASLIADFGEFYSEYLTPIDGRLYFSLYDSNYVEDVDPLWVYDPLANSGAGKLSSYFSDDFYYVDYLVDFQGKVYFVGYGDDFGTDVIGRFDPTANDGAGEFYPEIDLNDYLDGQLVEYLYGMTVVGDSLLFSSSLYEEYYDEEFDEFFYESSYVIWHYQPGDHQQSASLTPILESEGHLSIVTTSAQGVYISEYNWETDEGFLWNYQLTDEIEPVEVNGDFTTDFQFVESPGTIGTVDNNGPGSHAIFHEWEDVTGELWLTIDSEEVPSGPFNFAFQFSSTDSHLADPQLVSHLGGVSTWQTTEDGEARVTTGFLNGVNLSGYEVGDRVLVATISYPQDLDNLVGISSDLPGAYAQPIPAPGVEFLTANINGELDVTVTQEIGGGFVPVIYDTDDSGRVGLSDFVQFISHYGQFASEEFPDAYRFDFDRNGRVGLSDFVQFISNYGVSKTSPDRVNMPFIADLLEGEPIGLEGEPINFATSLLEGEPNPITPHSDATTTTPLNSPVEETFAVNPRPAFDPRLLDAVWREETLEDSDSEEDDEWLVALIGG